MRYWWSLLVATVGGLLLVACAAPATVPTSSPAREASPTPATPGGATAPASPIPQTNQETPKTAAVLTVYSGRSEQLVAPIIKQFSAATGIKVQVKYGGTSQIAATILEEGRNSPADVFFAQDPGGLGAVDSLLAPLPTSILEKVDPFYRSSQGKWVGISGRARVVVYNAQKLTENALPDDIWDFTDPEWKGRLGWAPTNGSFQAMVTAMRTMWGDEKTKQWLRGVQANNPKVFPNNTAIVQAVGAGEIDAGFVNHYYLFQILAEKGESFPARNYHPRAGGPGSAVMVAGAGVLETSKNKEAAERFLDFMLSPVAQQYFAGQTYEYPVISGVRTPRLLAPLTSLQAPQLEMSAYADLKGTLDMLRETGVTP